MPADVGEHRGMGIRQAGASAALVALLLPIGAPAFAAVDAGKKPKPRPQASGQHSAPIIAPGRYRCDSGGGFAPTIVVFKGNAFTQSYTDGARIGRGTYRAAPDVAPRVGGRTVWFTGGGLDGFPGEFVRAGSTDPSNGSVATENALYVAASPTGSFVLVCRVPQGG